MTQVTLKVEPELFACGEYCALEDRAKACLWEILACSDRKGLTVGRLRSVSRECMQQILCALRDAGFINIEPCGGTDQVVMATGRGARRHTDTERINAWRKKKRVDVAERAMPVAVVHQLDASFGLNIGERPTLPPPLSIRQASMLQINSQRGECAPCDLPSHTLGCDSVEVILRSGDEESRESRRDAPRLDGGNASAIRPHSEMSREVSAPVSFRGKKNLHSEGIREKMLGDGLSSKLADDLLSHLSNKRKKMNFYSWTNCCAIAKNKDWTVDEVVTKWLEREWGALEAHYLDGFTKPGLASQHPSAAVNPGERPGYVRDGRGVWRRRSGGVSL